MIIKPRLDQNVKRTKLRFLGYIGTFVSNLRSAAEMLKEDSPPRILTSILDPNAVQPGEFIDRDIPNESLCNESQVFAQHSLTVSRYCPLNESNRQLRISQSHTTASLMFH